MGQASVFSKASFEKSKKNADSFNNIQKSIVYPKGKKKRGISSFIAFVADTSYTLHTFNVALVSYKSQQQRINLRFSGNGKRGPPVLV